jgi:GNAT superfamily N-acetyltransferase
MKIIPFRDLESKDGLLPLLDHAFYWVFSQRQFDDLVKIDSRLKNGPVGFCAVEDGQIIGHVGVMDLPTRTLDRSIEYVGGLYNVATLPGYTRKGVCTTLMSRAHEYFMDKHYRFSFLSTSQALVAHALYEKLGYVDLTQHPSVYKVFHGKKTKHSPKREYQSL